MILLVSDRKIKDYLGSITKAKYLRKEIIEILSKYKNIKI